MIISTKSFKKGQQLSKNLAFFLVIFLQLLSFSAQACPTDDHRLTEFDFWLLDFEAM